MSNKDYFKPLFEGQKEQLNMKIKKHQEHMNTESFVAEQKRFDRMSFGLIKGLKIIWFMSTRNVNFYDRQLSFRCIDDIFQSVIAIRSLVQEGMLNVAYREMRYLLETTLKHSLVDINHPEMSIVEKIEYIKEKLPRSSVDFADKPQLQAFSINDNQDFYALAKSLFTDFCQYVHRSPEQIKEYINLSNTDITYGFETINELKLFTSKAIKEYDIVLSLYFHVLGLNLSEDIFIQYLDEENKWPYHKTKYTKKVSEYFKNGSRQL